MDIGLYNGETVTYFSSWAMFLAFLVEHSEEKRYHKFIAHNGGGFDYVSLIEYLTRQTKIKYEACLSQSKIVVLYVMLGKQRFEFVDSSNVFINISLADLCRKFDIKTPKLDGVDRQNIEREKVEDPERYYEYLGRDCISLYQVCKAFEGYLEIDFFPITLASLSLYLYRRRFQKHLLFSPSSKVDKFISEAYAGGRVEVFRPGQHENISVYDVNSLYPSVMRNAHFPVGTPVRAIKFHDDKIGVYKVRFEQSDRTIPPLLWYKNSVNGLEFVYEGDGYFFDAELRQAVEHGVTVKVESGYVWLRSAPLFKEFVDFYYKMRMENKGTALDYISKLLLNSLYGKFGQKENKHVLTRLNYSELMDLLHSPEEGLSVKEYDPKHGLYEVCHPRRVSHRIVNLAAQVTSMGRTILNNEILQNSETIAYCDTDSVHITAELPAEKVSACLGDWKLEKTGVGIYTGRKQYSLDDSIRFKGMRQKDTLGTGEKIMSRGDLSLISSGGQVMRSYSYFPKIRNVLKTGKKACRIYKVTKQLQRASYFSNFNP